MTSEIGYNEAFVWVWLPDEVRPIVAGRLAAAANQLVFNYGRSYLARKNAISLYEPELPLRSGPLPLLNGLRMPNCIRDAAPDAWGRRVIINRKLGAPRREIDTAELDELTICWSPVPIESAPSISSYRRLHTWRARRRWHRWTISCAASSGSRRAYPSVPISTWRCFTAARSAAHAQR